MDGQSFPRVPSWANASSTRSTVAIFQRLSDLPVPTAGMVTQYTSAQFKWQQAGITFRHSNGLVELNVCLYFIESLLKVSRDIWGVLSMYIFVIVFSDTLVTSTLHR